MYSGLGMNFGHDAAEWTEPGMTTRMSLLYDAGIKHIRFNLPSYQTEVSNTSYRDIFRLMITTWLNLHSDTTCVWGYTIAGSSPSLLTLTALEGAYRTAFLGIATWIATLDSGLQSRITIEFGNEDDGDTDTGTLSAADYRTYLRGTLATDFAAIAPLTKKSYSVRNDYISAWVSEGKGGLDNLGFTLYKPQTEFNTKLLQIYNAFGKFAYLSEFGFIDETDGIDFYKSDDEANNRNAWRQMDQCRKYGMKCYYFAFSTPSTTKFSIYPSGVFRNVFYRLTEERERYVQVTTPR